ncbi:hypothetical protein F5Y07DRAFT_214853 [Xylaria sp. FL0933]|nr:hypothetical protein F5Y07DRAFT_214853 [Xylaria sp. FL0933]
MSTTQYLPTRLVSRETGLSAILRRKTATQQLWPNPEHSIGRFICKVGKDSIWEAQGEAREAFKNIAPAIKRYLDSCIEPIPSWVTWSMYMIGHNVGSACPTIVFCCDVAAHRREVRSTIKQSGILDRYPGVKTGHMPRAPDFDRLIPLAAGNCSNKSEIRLEMSPSALGMPLFITGYAHGQQLSTKATIGGVIRVGRKYFYTTAAHPFQNHLNSTNPLEQPAFREQSNREIDDDACSFDGDLDAVSEAESELSPLSNLTAGEGRAHVREGPSPLTMKEQEVLEQSGGNEDDCLRILRSRESNRDREGYLDPKLSIRGPRFDYSEIDCHEFDYRGELFLVPRDSPGAEADFALLEVTDSRHWVPNLVSMHGKSKVAITSLSDADSKDMPTSHIYAITSRGNIQGRLSGTPLYVRTPKDKAFQEMLYATFNSNELEEGDCGSWVINRDTGSLYGHIVAGSPESGTALIKLFEDVFKHIQYRTGHLPTFPRSLTDNVQEGHWTTSRLKESGNSSSAPTDAQDIHDLETPSKCIEDRIESEANAKLFPAYKQSSSPHVFGTYGASKDAKGKGKAAQTAEFTTEERMVSVTPRFQIKIHKPKKLIYPALLYPDNNASFGPISSSLRPDQYGIGPPSYTSLRSQSLICSAKDSKKFCNLLSSLSRTPLGWENSGLLDEALRRIPLGRIYDDAENEFNTFRAISMSLGASGADWGYQDCVVRALMRWFRRDYFTWVNNPACDSCLNPTIAQGITAPTPEENIFGALRVEVYKCTQPSCSQWTRFPRYTDPWILMETCRGRVGEWVHVFSLFCCAVGARTRWVWSAEDHLWVEVYSKHVERWVHVDVLEGAWDNPALYSERWGKALSYCIAFSNEGAVDVTRRYVHKEELLKPRERCSELALFYMLKNITAERRAKFSKEDQERLRLGDAAEQKELQTFRVRSITREVIASLTPPSASSPGQHHPRSRESRNLPPKLALEEKWLEDTRKLMNDYCEWESAPPQR